MKFHIRFASFLLTLCLLIPFVSPNVQALTGSLEHFSISTTLPAAAFSDVSASAWYGAAQQNVISKIYSFGLMKGDSATCFRPEGSLSIAEAVTLADRVHLIYNSGEASLALSSPWYASSFTYAAENGLLPAGVTIAQASRPATRAEMAALFAAALPGSELPVLRSVASLPDVFSATPYQTQIFTLYEAGVLSGTDSTGTFFPYSSVTRAESAAIVLRLVNPDDRQSQALSPFSSSLNFSREYTTGMQVTSLNKIYTLCYSAASNLVHSFSITVSPTLYNEFTDNDFPFDEGISAISCSYSSASGLLNLNLDFFLMHEVSLLCQGQSTLSTASSTAASYYYKVSALAASLVQESMSSYQKAAAIHDYMVKTYHYDTRILSGQNISSSFSFTSLLDYNTGVCQAYAELYQLLLQKVGIPCQFVVGSSGTVSHAWNIIQLNGKYYQVDVTFDDPIPDKPGAILRNYFCVSDQVMAANHAWTRSDYPICPVSWS